ncbi:extracellular solute-binding protein [Caldicellulosiruptoraceae bacterium PP1]
MKRSKLSRLFAIVLLVVFALTIVYIPAYSSSTTTPAWKKDTKPVTFDWYLNFSWFPNKWGGNMVTDYITKKTGVKINFIVPAGNENEKLNVMIASNTLPDFITLGWWEDAVKKMISAKLVYPLDDLAKKYDPYFFNVANKQRLGWYTQDDGHVYGYPNASYTPSDLDNPNLRITSNQTFDVRKDMYEALGKPDFRKPETFLKALSDAKKKFPTVNGQPLIPIGFHEFTDVGNYSFESYLWNFLALPRERNGKLYDIVTHPEYLRWLKTFRKAYEMGLIAKDVFVDKRSQMEEKIAQGRYFSMLYQWTDFQAQQKELYNKNPNQIYIAVDGPANSKLEKPKLAGPGISGWTLTMISKNCKNPQRAISFMTYWLSPEGQKDFYLGVKDKMWTVKNGKEQMLPEVVKLMNTDRTAYDKKYGGELTYWMLGDWPLVSKWQPEEPITSKVLTDWTVGKAVSYAQYDNLNPPADTPEGVIAQKVAMKWGQTLPKLIMAKSDKEFDSIFKSLQDYKAKLGYNKVLAYQQKKLEENKKKLGIK